MSAEQEGIRPPGAGSMPNGPGGPKSGDSPAEATADPLLELQSRLEELTDRYQRALADHVNYQRRAMKERDAAHQRGMRDLLKGLLPSLDNLSRALAPEAGMDPERWRAGVQLVETEIQRVLAEMGIRCLDPRGEPFDPRVHEAIARAPTAVAPEGTVVEVAERGYVLGDLIIRPARVVVATAPTPPGEECKES
jgi:molecular chaperone GrpE